MSTRSCIPAFVVIAALALSGCGEDHGFKPIVPNPPRIYPYLYNPYLVIDALRTAYERRDTVEIKLLYDDAYQGSSIDQTDPVPAAIPFTKADEVAHVANLALNPAVHVSILPVPSLTRTSDPGDPPGWAIIQNPIVSLEVSDLAQDNRLDVANTTETFKFIPHTPDATSPTDTTWKIIGWTEVRN